MLSSSAGLSPRCRKRMTQPKLDTEFEADLPLSPPRNIWSLLQPFIPFSFFFLRVLFLFFKFYFIFKLYNIVLDLPNIEMNPPQVYMCSPSWTLLPPPSPYHPSGSSQPQASSIVHRTWTGDSFHTWYYRCFNAILPNHHTLYLSQSPKAVLYISVSFAISYTGLLLPYF